MVTQEAKDEWVRKKCTKWCEIYQMKIRPALCKELKQRARKNWELSQPENHNSADNYRMHLLIKPAPEYCAWCGTKKAGQSGYMIETLKMKKARFKRGGKQLMVGARRKKR